MLEGKYNYLLNNTQQLYKGNDFNAAINLLQKVKERKVNRYHSLAPS